MSIDDDSAARSFTAIVSVNRQAKVMLLPLQSLILRGRRITYVTVWNVLRQTFIDIECLDALGELLVKMLLVVKKNWE